MKARQDLLNSRPITLVVLFLGGVTAVRSWELLIRRMSQQTTLLYAPFYACSVVICASIALRSRFWPDRIVFAAIAGAFGTSVLSSYSPATGVSLTVANAVMWTIVTGISFFVVAVNIASSLKHSH